MYLVDKRVAQNSDRNLLTKTFDFVQNQSTYSRNTARMKDTIIQSRRGSNNSIASKYWSERETM